MVSPSFGWMGGEMGGPRRREQEGESSVTKVEELQVVS